MKGPLPLQWRERPLVGCWHRVLCSKQPLALFLCFVSKGEKKEGFVGWVTKRKRRRKAFYARKEGGKERSERVRVFPFFALLGFFFPAQMLRFHFCHFYTQHSWSPMGNCAISAIKVANIFPQSVTKPSGRFVLQVANVKLSRAIYFA